MVIIAFLWGIAFIFPLGVIVIKNLYNAIKSKDKSLVFKELYALIIFLTGILLGIVLMKEV